MPSARVAVIPRANLRRVNDAYRVKAGADPMLTRGILLEMAGRASNRQVNP